MSQVEQENGGATFDPVPAQQPEVFEEIELGAQTDRQLIGEEKQPATVWATPEAERAQSVDTQKSQGRDTAQVSKAPESKQVTSPPAAGPGAKGQGNPGPPSKPERVAFMDLYKYSTAREKLRVYFGLIMSMLAGAIQPTYCIIIGRIVEMFDPSLEADERRQMMLDFIWVIAVISVGTFFTSYLGYSFMQISAERLSFKLRALYLSSLMKQEIAFFEKQQIEALPSQMAEFFTHISEGSGEKLGQLIQTVGATCSAIIIGLAVCPYYALILIVYLPFATCIMTMLKNAMVKGIIAKFGANARLGGFTEEMLSSLKLIISFGKEQKKLAEYKQIALQSYKQAQRSAIIAGFSGGGFYGIMIGFSVFSWGIGFFMIKYEVPNPRYDRLITVGDIVTTYQGLIFAMFTVLQIQSLMPAVFRALTVGKKVIDIIDREPLIQSPKNQKERVTDIQIGEAISFDDIKFRYPTAPEHVRDVFEGASFKIRAGTSTAIVGPSGSGKSTIVQMLNRFYDPTQGNISYGTTPLKSIDLASLRELIGWVGQEPVLIVGTIRDNLLYGNKDAKEEDITRAINLANAQFVYTLEKKLDTYVGSSTVLNLSGGQKQRIAIARALIKRPQILVLDEATSALDPKSEAEVQNAIINVQKQQSGNLTIIMIAHRLQTIMTADNLLYLESPTSVLSAQKNTKEYKEIIDRLMRTNYAHQVEDQKAEAAKSAEQDAANDNQLLENPTLQEQNELKQSKTAVKEADAPEETTQKKEDKIQVQTAFVSRNAGWGRLFQYYKPFYVVPIMVFLAFCSSTGMPGVAYFIIRLQFIFYEKDTLEDWESDARLFLVLEASWVFMISLVVGIVKSLFGAMGEKLTYQLRIRIIEEILHKQISWFDREDRAPGILTNIISADISSLNGMTSEVLVTVFELLCVITLGFVGGLYFCWQAAIVCFICSPIMVFGMYMMSTMQFGNKGGRSKEAMADTEVDNYARSNALLSDTVINYRTVISLGQKNIDEINRKYEQLLTGPLDQSNRQSNKMGAYFALGVSGRTLYVSIVFIVGIELLIYKWGIDSTNVFTGIYLLFFTYMSIGAHAANVPSIKRAKAAAIPVFSIIDEISTLDVRKPEHRDIKEVKQGSIEFRNVTFSYPTRALKVMDRFNVEIPAGAKIALVGHSGCGKSTLTNILLRFYNINEGEVLIDGQDIDRYDVLALREQCGYVMQEPVLFNTDIKTNIRFGKPEATDEEVYIAAQKANAIQFIEDTSTESLTDSEKLERLNSQLAEVFRKHQKAAPAIAELLSGYQEASKDEKQTIIDLLTNCSSTFLSSAQSNIEGFQEAVRDALAKYGASWEDIVIRYEWLDQMANILSKNSADELMVQNVKDLLSRYPELYGCFDNNTVARAKAKGVSSCDDLAQVVREELSQYRMTVVNKRYQELQYQAIDKKRSADGTFTLHEGFNKDCGLKGGKLSGGQKQRIAIARALIKNPKILILDEATSALDEHSQEIVQQALDRAMEGRTSIVIAHRLSTIRNCDLLFLIGNGKVMETGSYKELAENPHSHFNVLKSGMEN